MNSPKRYFEKGRNGLDLKTPVVQR